jgi:nitronate monooxygenase
MKNSSPLTDALKIEFPLVMAPMFLVSNVDMMKAGIRAGIMATFPSLNFRRGGELASVIEELSLFHKQNPQGNYGVNLIVQKSNPYYKDHLKICVDHKVPFYITSLGNPREVIEAAHKYGAKVFCDVTTIAHAKKCNDADCDGFVAVGQGAGGHAGNNPLQVLVPALKKYFPGKLILAAGGIATGDGLLSVQALGADGGYVGTRFIASRECSVDPAYKQAILNAGMEDIIMTTKLSGSPCAIIDTPAAKKIGYSQNWFEKYMSSNPKTKKWFKMFVQARGMKKLEQSVLPNNYLRLWCAGKASELITDILSCEEIISKFKLEYNNSRDKLTATIF